MDLGTLILEILKISKPIQLGTMATLSESKLSLTLLVRRVENVYNGNTSTTLGE
jgi:hypothetical protein